MSFYLSLPLLFLKFWFFDAPKSILAYFASLNTTFLQIFSLPLLVKTYFRPWKNEYRKNFIAVAIGIGIFIKTFVIIADLLMLLILLAVELLCLIAFFLWPIGTIYLLFIPRL